MLDRISGSVKRGDSLPISWTGATPANGGVVDVSVARWDVLPRITLTCAASPSRGQVVFLPSMLARLEPGKYDVVAFSHGTAVDSLGALHELHAELPSQGSTAIVE